MNRKPFGLGFFKKWNSLYCDLFGTGVGCDGAGEHSTRQPINQPRRYPTGNIYAYPALGREPRAPTVEPDYSYDAPFIMIFNIIGTGVGCG
jgi:hypothetical protein